MRVLFVQDDVFKSQGVMILSAVLKQKGHKCDILVGAFHKKIVDKIIEHEPEILCFSLTTTKYGWFKKIARKAKDKIRVPIVVGGPHPTFYPEMIQEDFVDYLCIGEGEGPLLELVEAIEKGRDPTKIKNIWSKKNGKVQKNDLRDLVRDLDKLPEPDKELYNRYSYFKNLNVDNFIGSRGCPYNCTFCFNKKYNQLYKGKGKIMRRKSVGKLMKEIKTVLQKNKKVNHIIFEDDNFVLASKKWLEEFFRRYKEEIGVPYSVNLRADLSSEWLIRNLKDSGCHSIRIGLESADPYLRETILMKGITNEQVETATRLIREHKIEFQIYTILGIPGETIEMALNTYEFTKNLRPTNSWCSLLNPFPGTDIMDLVLKKKLIKRQDIDKLQPTFFKETPLDLPNKKELNNLQKLFQFGNKLRIPKKLMAYLIKSPSNFLYNTTFKVFYGLALKRMDQYSWSNILRTAYYSQNFF